MAPSATTDLSIHPSTHIKETVKPKKDSLPLPELTRKRLEKAGIDLSEGYPTRPDRPLYRVFPFLPHPSPSYSHPPTHPQTIPLQLTPSLVQDVLEIRSTPRPHHDAGLRADPKKPHLFGAAESITDLTKHIGTEVVGLRLDELTDAQKDELALLVAERGVVFFRGQEGLSPKVQRDLGEWFGEIEVHVCADFFFGVWEEKERGKERGERRKVVDE
jgi:hypothetical protein